MQEMKLQELKTKSPTELLSFAEEVEVENASAMRKQELMFAILKQLASRDIEITGTGVVEVLQDGFGFLRSPDANYLPGPDDIYVSPSQIRRFALTPGYQLCYALGMFEIEGLRSRFSPCLGFEGFHAVLLHGGQLPVELAADRLAAACEARRNRK